jgi:hypothetical protein
MLGFAVRMLAKRLLALVSLMLLELARTLRRIIIVVQDEFRLATKLGHRVEQQPIQALRRRNVALILVARSPSSLEKALTLRQVVLSNTSVVLTKCLSTTKLQQILAQMQLVPARRPLAVTMLVVKSLSRPVTAPTILDQPLTTVGRTEFR